MEINEWKMIDDKVPNERVLIFIPGIGQMTTQGGKYALQAVVELGATHWTNLPHDPEN